MSIPGGSTNVDAQHLDEEDNVGLMSRKLTGRRSELVVAGMTRENYRSGSGLARRVRKGLRLNIL